MAVDQPPAAVTKLNQGKITDKALGLANRKTRELEALVVQMFEEGQSVALWRRYLEICREIDDLWAELDVSCWTLGLLSPWVPQEKHGEPTLAQLDGNILAFTPDDKPELWTWSTLEKSIDFLQQQQVIGRDQWSGTVRGAAEVAKSQPIAIRFESQTDAFRKHLTEGFAAGDSVAEFKNRIKDTIDSTEAAVERNFRTSSKRAYLDGVDGVTRKNRFPYVKYVATTDNRTRPTHRAMDGKILKVGTPEYEQAQALQREYNCRCTLIPLTEKQAKREGADIPDLVVVAPEPAPIPKVEPKPEPLQREAPKPKEVKRSNVRVMAMDTDLKKDAPTLKLTEKKLVDIFAPPPNSTLQYVAADKNEVRVFIQNEKIESAIRVIRKDSAGKTVIENEFFKLKKTGTGLGTRMFADQVEGARKAGVDRIETKASRDSSWGGYYTWPRLGYDGVPVWRPGAPEKFTKMTSLLDVMETEEGRRAWREYGDTVDLTFDLKKGSRSLKVLADYLKSKE